MKKILLLSMVLMIAIGANAQIRWGVKAGGNLSKYTTFKYFDNSYGDQKTRFGFHVGGMMEYSFSDMFAIQPELQFIMNGGKMEIVEGNNVLNELTKSTFTMYQLQLPVNGKLKFGTDNLKMFVMAGPYVGLGLSAKQKFKNLDNVDDIDLYDNDGLQRIDFGINTAIGVELMGNIQASLGYQFGILNLAKQDNMKIKTGTALLSVGYFF